MSTKDVTDSLKISPKSVKILQEKIKTLEAANKKYIAQITSLQHSDDVHRAIVHDQVDLICRFLPDTTLTFVNKAYCNYFQKPADALIGKSFISLIPEFSRESAISYFQALANHPEILAHEHPVLNPEGDVRWHQWVNIPIKNQQGEVYEFQAVGRDITRMYELRKQYQLFYHAVNTSIDGIIITDLEGDITSINRAAEEIFQYDPGELIGENVENLNAQYGFSADVIIPAMKTTGRWKGEILQRHKDGSIFPVFLTTSLITDAENKPIGMIGVSRDISAQKETEATLLGYQSELRSLASALSASEERERRRITTILHDEIGQSLTLSMLHLEELTDGVASDTQKKQISKVYDLISKVLQHTRSLMFELSPPVLYELGFVAALEWLADKFESEHSIAITVKDDAALQPDDDTRMFLFQAIRELLLNIVKHSQSRTARVALRGEDDRLIIEVTDEGIGFRTQEIPRPSAANRGFGLFNIRERLHHYGGELSIISEKQQGTTVRLSLPLTANP